MRTTKITIGRLFNLGSYEHVRYEITAEIGPKESAAKALVNLEKIVDALKPERSQCVSTDGELSREKHRIDEMLQDLIKKGDEEFRRRHGHFEGTPLEYIARLQKSYDEGVAKRRDYKARSLAAREMLDHLGGAAEWKDAKLDWETDQGY